MSRLFKKDSFDSSTTLGKSCALSLINFNEEELKTLPLGIDDGKLTNDFTKSFDRVVRKHARESKDTKSTIITCANKMIDSGHNRYKLVIEHTLRSL